MLFARDGLEQLIVELRKSGAKRIDVVGHSMGTLLVVETLRQMDIANPGSVANVVAGLVLMLPDIDVEVFRSQLSRIRDLPQPFVIFVSHRDRVLLLSGKLTGQNERLGNIKNYAELDGLKLTIMDVTQFSKGLGHFALGDSPSLLQFISNIPHLERAFNQDSSARTGLIPGMVLVVQNADENIAAPTRLLAR